MVRLEKDFHHIPSKYASSTQGQCQALLSWRGLERGHHHSCLFSSCILTVTRKPYVARRFLKCSGRYHKGRGWNPANKNTLELLLKKYSMFPTLHWSLNSSGSLTGKFHQPALFLRLDLAASVPGMNCRSAEIWIPSALEVAGGAWSNWHHWTGHLQLPPTHSPLHAVYVFVLCASLKRVGNL